MDAIKQRGHFARPATLDDARRAMINCQLRTSGVNQPWVLSAMARVPREHYVPEAARDAAYIDRAIALGGGRWLAPPVVHARMLAEAEPSHADHTLLVGDRDGYLAALLRPLVGSLVIADVASSAITPPKGLFSLIIIDGAVELLPESYARALTADGRLVTGLVERGVTRLAMARAAGGALALLPLAELGIPVLAEFAAPRRWSF